MEEKNIGEKFLPLGTVVMLKGAYKRVMITGFCVVDENNKEKIWDYSGCMYPEGFLSSDPKCLFEHDQIEKIYHMGLADDPEEKQFKEQLKSLYEVAQEQLNNQGNVE